MATILIRVIKLMYSFHNNIIFTPLVINVSTPSVLVLESHVTIKVRPILELHLEFSIFGHTILPRCSSKLHQNVIIYIKNKKGTHLQPT